MVWTDERGWMATREREGSVRLAVLGTGTHAVAAVVGGVALTAVGIGLFAAADTTSGEAEDIAYQAVALPPTPTPVPTATPEPTPTPEPGDEGATDEEPPGIDVSQFGTERPGGLVDGTLFDLLTGAGVDPQQAVCTGETLLSRVSQEELLAAGLATFSDEAIEPVVAAALDCGIDQGLIDAAVAAARGE